MSELRARACVCVLVGKILEFKIKIERESSFFLCKS